VRQSLSKLKASLLIRPSTLRNLDDKSSREGAPSSNRRMHQPSKTPPKINLLRKINLPRESNLPRKSEAASHVHRSRKDSSEATSHVSRTRTE
jgi:hypothetical protein